MGRIIFGLILTIGGAFMTIKSEGFLMTFGRVPWAEENLGAEGGSRLFYQLLGILLIIVGFMFITGLTSGIFEWMARNLFGGMAPR